MSCRTAVRQETIFDDSFRSALGDVLNSGLLGEGIDISRFLFLTLDKYHGAIALGQDIGVVMFSDSPTHGNANEQLGRYLGEHSQEFSNINYVIRREAGRSYCAWGSVP